MKRKYTVMKVKAFIASYLNTYFELLSKKKKQSWAAVIITNKSRMSLFWLENIYNGTLIEFGIFIEFIKYYNKLKLNSYLSRYDQIWVFCR